MSSPKVLPASSDQITNAGGDRVRRFMQRDQAEKKSLGTT
jgi:hypothetical protein